MKKIRISIYSLIELLLVIGIMISVCLPFILDGSEKTYKIAVILGQSQSSGWDTYIAGMYNACEDYSSDVYILPTYDMLEPDKAVEMAVEQINQGADAVIVQSNDGVLLNESIVSMPYEVPIVIVDGYDTMTDADKDNCAFMGFDNTSIGRTLASEAEKVYDSGLAGKKIGIVSTSTRQYNIANRKVALVNKLEKLGGMVAWTYEYANEEEKFENLIQQKIYKYPIDILIALDNDSMEAAIRCKTSHMNNNENIAIIGVGYSNMVLYHLDTGIVEVVIVPDYFEMGYSTIRQISAKLESRYAGFEDVTSTYWVVYRDTMFDDEHQKYLFGVE